MGSFEDLKSQRAGGFLSQRDFADAVATLSEDYVYTPKHALEHAEFRELAWRYRHSKLCPITPRADGGCRRMIWADGSGSICCPWSAMGARSMWLDRASLAFFVWAYSSRYFEPDLIVHECAVAFPEQALADIFGPPSPSPPSVPIMKSPWARPPGNGPEGYLLASHTWSPVDLGIPSNRPRKYTSMHLIGSLARCGLEDVDIARLFYRRLDADPSVYFSAPASQQNLELSGSRGSRDSRVEGRATIDGGALSAACSAGVLLSNADYARLEGYVVEALNRGRECPSCPPPPTNTHKKEKERQITTEVTLLVLEFCLARWGLLQGVFVRGDSDTRLPPPTLPVGFLF